MWLKAVKILFDLTQNNLSFSFRIMGRLLKNKDNCIKLKIVSSAICYHHYC